MSRASPARKCTPSTMASVEMTRSNPGLERQDRGVVHQIQRARIAARERAQPTRSRRIRQVSPTGADPARPRDRHHAPRRPKAPLMKLGLWTIEKGFRDLDIFIDHHFAGHLRPPQQARTPRSGGRPGRWRRAGPSSSRRRAWIGIACVDIAPELSTTPRARAEKNTSSLGREALSSSTSCSKRCSWNSRMTSSTPAPVVSS